jgi:hypothetical protein
MLRTRGPEKWGNAEDDPTDKYKRAFVWYDAKEKSSSARTSSR